VIGTADGVRRLRSWANALTGFIDVPPSDPRSRAVEPQHVPFPGFAEAFHAEWPAEPTRAITDLDPAQIDRALKVANRHEAIRATVDIFVNRLVDENNRIESPPAFWFVVIPESVYELGRPQSSVKKDERVLGTVTVSQRRARQLAVEPTLFGDEEREAEVYQYAAHFRRQLKARLLKEQDRYPDRARDAVDSRRVSPRQRHAGSSDRRPRDHRLGAHHKTGARAFPGSPPDGERA
jgi:hypothetical protein